MSDIYCESIGFREWKILYFWQSFIGNNRKDREHKENGHIRVIETFIVKNAASPNATERRRAVYVLGRIVNLVNLIEVLHTQSIFSCDSESRFGMKLRKLFLLSCELLELLKQTRL